MLIRNNKSSNNENALKMAIDIGFCKGLILLFYKFKNINKEINMWDVCYGSCS